MGATFDWGAEVVTCDPSYYRWNQWLFLQFLKAGLAYRATSPVDWCPNDGTLAREQVEGADRRCWRCGAKVEKRDLDQWYLRITKYADELLDFTGHRLARADPPHADELDRALRGRRGRLPRARPTATTRAATRSGVFTTRPDTLFGATFMVLAPEHPLVEKLTSPGQRGRSSRRTSSRPAARPRSSASPPSARRPASPLGADAINPVNGERIPIWIADYVLAGYGTGAIMAVPAHDERDFAFARQFGLPIRRGDPAGGAHERRGELDGGLRLADGRRRPGQLGPLQRDGGRRRRSAASPPTLRGARRGQRRGHLPHPRLADQPPALLGHADPDRLLRARRDRAGAGGPAAGPAAARRSTTPAPATTRSSATRRS